DAVRRIRGRRLPSAGIDVSEAARPDDGLVIDQRQRQRRQALGGDLLLHPALQRLDGGGIFRIRPDVGGAGRGATKSKDTENERQTHSCSLRDKGRSRCTLPGRTGPRKEKVPSD